jgi:hypothetical protein
MPRVRVNDGTRAVPMRSRQGRLSVPWSKVTPAPDIESVPCAKHDSCLKLVLAGS